MYNKTHMCVNNLLYVEYGHELQALGTCTYALYLSAIMIFYDAK